MIILPPRTAGFTLIELMVVISIIGLLSSILAGSLSTTRLKARDAKIKQQVLQLRNLIELDYLETTPNSYGNLQTGWYSTAAECAAGAFLGNYVSKARDICSAIVTSSSNSNFAANSLYIGNNVNLTTKYGIMAYLPGKQTFFCLGSSGKPSDTTTSVNAWTQTGCFDNP
jgi:prepilin-type N-terminal cleavage/methylation domain-containing protein